MTSVHRTRQRTRRVVHGALHRTAAVVGVVVCIVLLWLLWPARFGGSTTFVVVSGSSMEPTFHTGDLLVVREGVPRVGDVVAFRIPGRDGQIVHRVIDRRADGTLLVQGDNRESPDMPMPTDADVIGVSSLLVPRGAIWVRLLTSPLVLGVGVGSWVLASGVHRHRRDHARVLRQVQMARARALADATWAGPPRPPTPPIAPLTPTAPLTSTRRPDGALRH